MALIQCPECSKSVSDIAAACPDCGYPIYQAKNSGHNLDPATTIEQTSKKWKKLKLLASAFIIVGFIVASKGDTAVYFGTPMIFIGLLILLYSGFGSWWHHS